MKKSILALLILLAVLIVTCVYQKTYTIYASSPKEIKLVERKTAVEIQSIEKTVAVEKKEQKTSTLPVVSVPTPTKHVEEKPVPKTKPVIEHKPVVTTEKAVTKEAKEKIEPSTTNSTPVASSPVIITNEVTTPKPAAAEQEIVDYLMWALKNRDLALKNRDEVEARIQELINKALKDRKVVLEERKNNEVALEKLQTELIDARDASYESVINPKTPKQGKK